MTASPCLAGLAAMSDQTRRLFHQQFDADFYRRQLAEAPPGAALPRDLADPAAHFLDEGWQLGLWPCRWFDPLGYLAATPELGAMGINPFLHYLEVGLGEDARAMPFFRDRARRPEGLQRFGRAEYGPVAHVLRYEGTVPSLDDLPGRVVVQLHLFYPEMAAELCALLAHLPLAFDLLVSVPEGRGTAALKALFRDALPRAGRITFREVANRGRDVAPWMVSFRPELLALGDRDLVLHLHSKKSAHGDYHAGWGAFLGHSLLGSPAVAAQALALFAKDPKLGLLAPAYWPQLRRAPNYGAVRDLCAHLMRRMGLGEIAPVCADFPAGSFFWARAAVLRPFLALGLEARDFPMEAGQICGTTAHAVERLLGAVPAKLGLRFEMVAVDLPFEQAPHRPPSPLSAPPETGAAEGEPEAGPAISILCAPPQAADSAPLRALGGALAQMRPGDELIVAVAGGQDAVLRQITDRFAGEIADGRLRLLAASGTGQAAALALAQDEARGQVVSYLCAESLWHPAHLDGLRAAFRARPDRVLLCAAEGGQRTRADLLQEPGLPLSAYAHGRDVLDGSQGGGQDGRPDGGQGGGQGSGLRCDPALGEAGAWAFVLELTARAAPDRLARPTVAFAGPPLPLPGPQRRGVQLRHRNERLYHRQDAIQIALKVPAPRPLYKHRWGDLHLAESLARALEARGCRTRVDILPDWYHHHPEDDAVLVLRGVTPYVPDRRHINMMWNISHPDRVSLEEMQGYDHVFVSAYRRGAEVIRQLGMRASVMLQCADPTRFHPEVDLTGVPRHEVLFVGNSRRQHRWITQACITRGLPLAIYGAEWEGLVPPSYVKASHVPNDRLAAWYRGSRIVLNDHWPQMAAAGYVSNRIMDVGLAGGMVISDHFEGAEAFMGHVVTCRSPAEVEAAIRHYLADEAARLDKARGLHRLISLHHQVEQRADQVLATLRGLLRDRWQQLRPTIDPGAAAPAP